MRRLGLLALLFALFSTEVVAQSSVYVCVGPPGIGACAPVSATNPLPITGTITPASGGATGAAVPATADYVGINVAGTLRGLTGVNPSSSIYAGQVDIASWAGTTAAAGSGAMTAGTPRVALATDSPGLIAVGTFGTPSSDVISTQTNDPCFAQPKSSAAINVTSGTTTSLVAVSGSTTVYICGFAITIAPSAITAATALFEYGTGAACTSPTALTGTFGNGDLTSAAGVAPILYGNGSATIFKSAAASGICILTAGNSVNVQGVLSYVQQ